MNLRVIGEDNSFGPYMHIHVCTAHILFLFMLLNFVWDSMFVYVCLHVDKCLCVYENIHAQCTCGNHMRTLDTLLCHSSLIFLSLELEWWCASYWDPCILFLPTPSAGVAFVHVVMPDFLCRFWEFDLKSSFLFLSSEPLLQPCCFSLIVAGYLSLAFNSWQFFDSCRPSSMIIGMCQHGQLIVIVITIIITFITFGILFFLR